MRPSSLRIGAFRRQLHGDRRGVECGSRGLPQGVKAMSIKREDVDTGRIDFAEVITGKKLPPIHPGEILRNEFLDP
jgi:hypothetical protein